MKKVIFYIEELQDFLLLCLFLFVPFLAYKIGALLFDSYQGVILTMFASWFIILFIAFILLNTKDRVANIILSCLLLGSIIYFNYLPDFSQCHVKYTFGKAWDHMYVPLEEVPTSDLKI